MTIFQIVARGHVACFGGSPKTIMSKELYTSHPGNKEKEAFRLKCIKCEGFLDIYSLDPNGEITITVASRELIDNGDKL